MKIYKYEDIQMCSWSIGSEFQEIGFLVRNSTKPGHPVEEIRFLYRRSSG
jgi:hypothetical protein